MFSLFSWRLDFPRRPLFLRAPLYKSVASCCLVSNVRPSLAVGIKSRRRRSRYIWSFKTIKAQLKINIHLKLRSCWKSTSSWKTKIKFKGYTSRYTSNKEEERKDGYEKSIFRCINAVVAGIEMFHQLRWTTRTQRKFHDFEEIPKKFDDFEEIWKKFDDFEEISKKFDDFEDIPKKFDDFEEIPKEFWVSEQMRG